MTNIIYFENEAHVINLHPINYLRSTVDLRVGGYTLLEKWRYYFSPDRDYILTRSYLQNYTDEYFQQQWSFSEDESGEYLWINSQVLPDKHLIEDIKSAGMETVAFNKERVVFIKTQKAPDKNNAFPDQDSFEFSRFEIPDIKWLEYPWDLVEFNEQEIDNDVEIFTSMTQLDRSVIDSINALIKEKVFVSQSAKIYHNVFLDAQKGPVIVDDEAEIYPFSYIQGPVFIGKKAVVKPNSRILSGTTIGPVSKVAGEINHSIFHSFSNKQHDGFLGHSYMCPWVNLGADTNNSNLKNNYLPVKVPINSSEVNTGLQFAGLFAGDHAKSGINTMFNTGTVLGCFANVYGGDYPHKFIPNFAWGNNRPFLTYHLNKAIATARIVKERRDKQISDSEEAMIREVFELTKHERTRKT